MRINTISELTAELKRRWLDHNVQFYGKFYAADKMDKTIQVIDLSKHADVHIGKHILSEYENSYNLIWVEDEHGYLDQRVVSLRSMNVVENYDDQNFYNDCCMFTTEEEAFEFSNPVNANVKVVRTKLVLRDIFECGLMSVLQDIGWDKKIACIKAIRTITGTGLKEAKDYFEYHNEKRGTDYNYRGDQEAMKVIAEDLRKD